MYFRDTGTSIPRFLIGIILRIRRYEVLRPDVLIPKSKDPEGSVRPLSSSRMQAEGLHKIALWRRANHLRGRALWKVVEVHPGMKAATCLSRVVARGSHLLVQSLREARALDHSVIPPLAASTTIMLYGVGARRIRPHTWTGTRSRRAKVQPGTLGRYWPR